MARLFPWLLASLVAISGCPVSDVGSDDDDSDPCEEHVWFRDADGDSWGDTGAPQASCAQPLWYVATDGDCDDEDETIHPDADEVCDEVDNDCDGEVDEGFELQTWYQDLDGDGYGNSLAVTQARCVAPDGYVDIAGDCDDTEPDAHPGLAEVLCDGIDNDCDGVGNGEVAAVLNGVEHATIADAMLNAAFGETVFICPGEHTEALVVGADDEMTLTAYSGSAEDTVLDGEGVRVILSIGFEAQVTLTDLTFRNGNALQDAGQAGGAVFSYGRSLTLQRCRFEENQSSEEGGAVYSHAWDDTYDVVTLVESCTFTGNWSESEGGAIETSAWGVATLTVTDSIFEGNESDSGGGVISAGGQGSAFVYVSNSEFTANRAGGEGGVFYLSQWGAGELDVSDSAFTGNLGQDSGGVICRGGYGNSNLSLTDSTFEDNESPDLGGAIAISGWGASDLTLTNCDLLNNDAPDGAAIGYSSQGESNTLTVVDSTIDGNLSINTGAIGGPGQDPVDIQIQDSAITSNVNGGCTLYDTWTLTSTNVDWGTGATDNTAFDVKTATGTYWFGTGATFTCDGSGICA